MVKHTKKEFTDYNEYRNRKFDLKWSTAFALDDLMKGVFANENYALKDNQALPQMSREAIDIALSESCLQQKEVEVQLNLRDELDRLQDKCTGFFLGEAYEDYFVIADRSIVWEDVRHVSIIEPNKWYTADIFESPQKKKTLAEGKEQLQELQLTKDEFYQDFPEDFPYDDHKRV